MQDTRLQTIAKAVCKRQGRYQRNTHLFDQLVQLLVQGRPVAPELLARRLNRELDEVLSILRAHPELEYDEHGNLVRSGLTLVPTAHQFQVEQRTLFAWCAFDTLTYPVELHLSAHITSRCPVNGRSIRRERVAQITYWHVELTAHAIILAEGLLTESYLDTGNRSAFENAAPPSRLTARET